MNPLDRINQLTKEVGTLTRGNVLLREMNRKQELRCSELATDALAASEAHAAANRLLSLERDSNALLRSQLHDAQEQAKRDSETIARLAKDKQDIGLRCDSGDELLNAILLWIEADMRQTHPPAESMAACFLQTFCKNTRAHLSRHA